MIRILIADDHPLIRSGICMELNHHSDLQIIGEAISGDEILSMTNKLKPDILLLDINMPGMKAIQVLQQLKRFENSCRVLVLSAYSDTGTVIGLLRAGADGYMLKEEEPFIIPEAIRAVIQGKPWISQSLSEKLALLSYETSKTGHILTNREYEILGLIINGNTNKEIASSLRTSERTVEFHISNVLQKLKVRSRLEAALWAKENGL